MDARQESGRLLAEDKRIKCVQDSSASPSSFSGWRFETVAHTALNEWHSLFYPAGVGPKSLSPSVVGLVGAFELAVWFMDDGCAAWWPSIAFGMPTESREIAASVFARFGLTPRWVFHKGSSGEFIFEGEDQAHLFIALVKPHIPECMQYKLDFGFQGQHYQIRQALPERTLREMATQGVPIRRMARELGVPATTIERRLRSLGIPHPRKVGRPAV